MIPQLESPPRVRVEWLIAGARMVLAAGTLLASRSIPCASVARTVPTCSDGTSSTAWRCSPWSGPPIRFARGWDIVVHIVDVAVFALWVAAAGRAGAIPLVVFYVFVVVCATLRWQTTGTVWTAAAALAAYAAIESSPREWWGPHRSLSVFAAAGRVPRADRGAHRLSRDASAPLPVPRSAASRRGRRKPTRDPRERWCRRSSGSPVNSWARPRIVLVWEEPGEGWVNVAGSRRTRSMWTQEPEATYGSFVLPGLERSRAFRCRTRRRARPRAAAASHAVSAGAHAARSTKRCGPASTCAACSRGRSTGELIRGRMFCLDKARMRLDDLVLGEVVAWLAVTRLESLYWQDRLREAAALDERVRLARDLHDSLLQSQAGAALQLVAARRLLDRDPAAGKQRLADVQQQLERDELEMRSFVTRPAAGEPAGGAPATDEPWRAAGRAAAAGRASVGDPRQTAPRRRRWPARRDPRGHVSAGAGEHRQRRASRRRVGHRRHAVDEPKASFACELPTMAVVSRSRGRTIWRR